MDQTSLVAQVTPDIIQEWKAKYGAFSLSQADIVLDRQKGEEGAEDLVHTTQFILKVPSRSTMDAVAQKGKEGKITECNKLLIANSVLAGDMELLDQNGNVYTAVLNEIRKLVQQSEVTTKKL